VSSLHVNITHIYSPIKHSTLRPGLLYRSARPDEASASDQQFLQHTLHLKTVIDLRSTTEHLEQARKHAAAQSSASSSSFPPSLSSSDPPAPNTTTTPQPYPAKIPTIVYHPINFNGTSFSLGLMRRMPLLATGKMLTLLALGYRTTAISVLSAHVMAPRGLVGLAHDSLAFCAAEVRAVFRVLADQTAYPLLVHCTQGKDRTGLVVVLVLMLCGVGEEAVRVDYLRSQKELKGEREAKLVEIRSIGLPDEFADCPEDWVEKVVEHVNGQYGGVEGYLSWCGVKHEMQADIKRILLC